MIDGDVCPSVPFLHIMRNSVVPALEPLPSSLSAHTPRTGQVFAKATGSRSQSWFRIENAAADDGTDRADAPAKVYIYDEIGIWGVDAQSFVKELMQIDNPQIELHLNSPGGSVFHGVAIYNALRMHDAEVTVIVDSLAASAASFIAQAGDKLIMTPNATMMIHDASAVCFGNAKDMADTANILDKISNNIASIYASRAGESNDFWRSLMQTEVWYNADETVAAGLADEVLDLADKKNAENSWDLSIFNHMGREDAPSPESIRKNVVLNQAKEAPVTAPKKTEAEVAAEAAATAAAEAAKHNAPEAGFSMVLPDGSTATSAEQVTAYFASVQAENATLKAAQAETQQGNRKAFVKQLCDEKKILASQVASLESLVLDPNFTDTQYDAWVATYENAPVIALLSSVSDGKTNPAGDAPAGADKAEDDLDIAREIVRQNRRASMSQERLETTKSWLKLKAAGQLDSI